MCVTLKFTQNLSCRVESEVYNYFLFGVQEAE